MTTKLKDVAEACGVDVSTASRALRGDPRVAPATRAVVEAAARSLAYRPNLAGRRLQAGHTGTVWFVTSWLSSAREREPAEHATRCLARAGYDTLIAVHLGDPAAYQRVIERLDQGIADGALIIPGGGRGVDAPLLHELVRRRYPFCFIDRWPPEMDAPVVTTDNAAAGAALAKGLLELGAEQVLVDLEPVNSVQEERRQGALQVLGDRAVARPSAGCIGVLANDQGSAHRSLAGLAGTGRRLVTAVFDEWGGDPFPAEVALVAIQDFEAMAERGAHRLLAMLQGGAWKSGIEYVPLARIETRRTVAVRG